MRRLLMLFFVVFFLGLVPVASAATQPAGVAVSVAGGGFSLADVMNWVRQLWEAATDAGLPPPGITNGSCVDPDGSSCHSH
ncbi:MAG TPA: hypothetical protein VH988_10595 [Thermoanaerobaculia bacterium]|jgi:CBS domain containing-hemolysin-like protein|nr:hypothetical protein [Thermoanaerobaculia bacterium]